MHVPWHAVLRTLCTNHRAALLLVAASQKKVPDGVKVVMLPEMATASDTSLAMANKLQLWIYENDLCTIPSVKEYMVINFKVAQYRHLQVHQLPIIPYKVRLHPSGSAAPPCMRLPMRNL